jgi:hypothetical protein
VNARTGDRVSVTGSSVEVRHRSGIQEVLTPDRYIMRDRRGRTIISRPANNSDRARFRSMTD